MNTSRKTGKLQAHADALRMRLPGMLRAVEPKDTAKVVGLKTDTDWRTVRDWLDGKCLPQVHKVLALCRVYGPAFAADLDPDAEWSRLLAERAEIEELHQRLRKLADQLEATGSRR